MGCLVDDCDIADLLFIYFSNQGNMSVYSAEQRKPIYEIGFYSDSSVNSKMRVKHSIKYLLYNLPCDKMRESYRESYRES